MKTLNEILLDTLDFYNIPHYMEISDSEKNVLYIDTGYKAKSNIRIFDIYTIDNNKKPGFYEIFCNIEVNGDKNVVTLAEIIFACNLIRNLIY